MNGRKLEDIDPLLELRDRYKLKNTARTVGGLIKAIISYEKKYYDEQIKIEEGAFVGERVTKTEAVLQNE